MDKSVSSTQRFSDRVSTYTRYRPGYPPEAMEYLFNLAKVDSNTTIADVGAGTGLLTRLLLSKECEVIAVEPNESMRLASDLELSESPNYRSVGATAEATGLAEHSVDLITAAQAFHWFDIEKTKKEFRKILKPQGAVALIWNRRDSVNSEFLKQYDALLTKKVPEYSRVNHATLSDELIKEFLGTGMQLESFVNYQEFDFEGLKGRLMSSSYCPAPGAQGHDELMGDLETLYREHASGSKVRFDYSTQVYYSGAGFGD